MIRHHYHRDPLSVRVNVLKEHFRAEAIVQVKYLTDEQASKVIGFLSPMDLNEVHGFGAFVSNEDVAFKISTRRWVGLAYLRRHSKERIKVPMDQGTMSFVKAVAGNLFAVVGGEP